jgi:hypothetical protein
MPLMNVDFLPCVGHARRLNMPCPGMFLYGQKSVMEVLIDSGAGPNIKNHFPFLGNTSYTSIEKGNGS